MIDDPIKDREEADSAAFRARIWAWFTQVAMTRLMPEAVVLLCLTRWHEDDLAGRILASPAGSKWEQLVLPALAEEDDPLGRSQGEALWPDWYPAESLPSVAAGEIDSRGFAAVYQQRPTLEQGGLIKREWLSGRYERAPEGLRLVQAIDTAFKTGVANDFSVIATWGTDGRDFYLVDLCRRRVEFPELMRAIEAEARKYRPEKILVEDSASGQSAIQQLRATTSLPVLAIPPRGSKESRVAAVSGLLEAGKVMLPSNAHWLSDWRSTWPSRRAAGTTRSIRRRSRSSICGPGGGRRCAC